jgi:hypothetical protein
MQMLMARSSPISHPVKHADSTRNGHDKNPEKYVRNQIDLSIYGLPSPEVSDEYIRRRYFGFVALNQLSDVEREVLEDEMQFRMQMLRPQILK